MWKPQNTPYLPQFPPPDSPYAGVEWDGLRLARRLFLLFLILEIALCLFDFLFAYSKLIETRPLQRLFNLTREDGLGSLVGVLQCFLVAGTCAAITRLHRVQKKAEPVWGWQLTTGFFLYLTIDDGSKLHERVGTTFRFLAESSPENSLGKIFALFPSYSWQVIFLPLFGLVGTLMLRHLWRTFATFPRLRIALLGAFTCFGLAILFDYFEGVEGAHLALANSLGTRTYTVSHFSKVTEEFLEMFGTTLFLVTFMEYLGRTFPKIHLIPPNPS